MKTAKRRLSGSISKAEQLKRQNEILKNERLKQKQAKEGAQGMTETGNYNNEGHMIVGPRGERKINTIGAYFPNLVVGDTEVSPGLENDGISDNDNLLSALIGETNFGTAGSKSGKDTNQKTVPYDSKHIMFDLGISVQRPQENTNSSDVANLKVATNCVALLHGGAYLRDASEVISFESFNFAYEGLKGKKELKEYLKSFADAVAEYYSDLIDVVGIHNFENRQTVAYLLQIDGQSPFSHKSVNLSLLKDRGDRRGLKGTEDLHNVYMRVLAEGFDKLISSKEKDSVSLDSTAYQEILDTGKYTLFLKTRK